MIIYDARSIQPVPPIIITQWNKHTDDIISSIYLPAETQQENPFHPTPCVCYVALVQYVFTNCQYNRGCCQYYASHLSVPKTFPVTHFRLGRPLWVRHCAREPQSVMEIRITRPLSCDLSILAIRMSSAFFTCHYGANEQFDVIMTVWRWPLPYWHVSKRSNVLFSVFCSAKEWNL